MPEQVLTLLKYVVLAVLYLFFLRVLRAVWVELREPKVMAVPATGPPPPPAQAVPSPPSPPKPAQPGPCLVITAPPPRQGQRIGASQEITIGRAAGCAVSLPEDTFVSQLHARVFPRDGALWVEDLGSTNGTFLNANKVTAPVPLHLGDQLQVGNTVLECSE